MIEILEKLFVGPIWPASMLVCLLALYALVALLGLIDLDLGGADVDLSPDVDLDGALPDVSGGDVDMDGDLLGGLGGATLRWLNLDRLPLIVWGSMFTVVFWAISYGLWYGFDVRRYEPTVMTSLLLIARNSVLSIGITKFGTDPLNRLFQPAPRFSPSNLIGQTCQISTGEATDSAGQAKFKTDAAPLLLNVRTDGERITKGEVVQIIAFDADRRIYKVSAMPQEVS
ncbi:MAG: DUF1449 domain-containing protein [Planctomycetota bacterium]